MRWHLESPIGAHFVNDNGGEVYEDGIVLIIFGTD